MESGSKRSTSHRRHKRTTFQSGYVQALILSVCLLLGKGMAAAETKYFPLESAKQQGISEFEVKWYGEALSRMEEPSLFALAKNSEQHIMRALLLPTWGNPISVRIEKIGDRYNLIARRLGGQGGYDPGKLVEKEERALKESEIKNFEEKLAALKYWDLPTEDPVSGHDGEQWIIEGRRGNDYHVVVRWCPDEYDPKKRGTEAYVDVFATFLKLAGMYEKATNRGRSVFP